MENSTFEVAFFYTLRTIHFYLLFFHLFCIDGIFCISYPIHTNIDHFFQFFSSYNLFQHIRISILKSSISFYCSYISKGDPKIALQTDTKTVIRSVGHPPDKGGSLWHSSCLMSPPMSWRASLWRSLSVTSVTKK